mgnify:FL=1
MEKLDRSVVAQKVSNGVYVNWRITADEWHNTAYKLYRDGSLIYTTTVTGASNYLDATGTINSKYTVSKVKNGVESAQSAQTSVLTKNYLEIPVRDIKSLGKTLYYLNDATAADLDGDGQYEIIVKRMNRDWDASNTNFTYFEAYKLDGTFMWAIDVGPNITMDVEINIAAYDFDGDGKAEVFMRSSDGTIFGLDKNNQNGTPVGDRDGDGYINYRQAPFNGIGGDGFMNAGPEYLSLIDGMTGKELDWKNFIARGNSNDWGDGYGHRANKFFFGAPYLDGKKPSLFIGRGIYTQTKMQTYDVVNKKLIAKWFWESGSSSTRQQGKWDTTSKSYYGQGYHNYTIADVDDDGKDEINWGSMTVDDDGLPLYSTELGHGDAQHYGDFDPYRKGQEMFACNETNPGTNLRDAKTGKLLYRKEAASDVGRAGAGNISDAYRGTEVWGNGVGLSSTDRVEMGSFGVAENYCVYWDGDLLQEILDHSGFSTPTGVGYGAITKFNGFGNISTLLSADAYSCNYTKGTPCLQADIMGDWREEAIWWRSDSLALRVYTTPIATSNRIYTLMHDHQYRQAICWQMCGYNQPPHTSFYLGSDFPTPVPPKSTNGKLVWKASSSNWDTSTASWLDGDNGSVIIPETGSFSTFSNGKSVLFDNRSTVNNITISSNLSPETMTVSGSVNYNFSGTGSLEGTMHFDKMGEGSVTLSGTHTYSGNTEVWEGDMILNGTLSASNVILRRFGSLGGNGSIGQNVSMEYGSILYPGGNGTTANMTIGSLTMNEGAVIKFDLSDKNTANAGANQNDLLTINGSLTLGTKLILNVNPISGTVAEGDYILAQIGGTITGNPSSFTVNGILGKKASLIVESGKLILRIIGVRDASVINWNGGTSSVWDVSTTVNWINNNNPDIFVYKDSVEFNDSAVRKAVTLTGSLAPANIKIDNTQAYTFDGTGIITGTTSLYKTNKGTVTINNRNDFTGKTLIDGGTLILKYAPSLTNYGGIGGNIADPSYLILKDSATLQFLTNNEITSRGLTVTGTAGGVLNTPLDIYWNGQIIGTKLTKIGAGKIFIESNNTSLNETILRSGTIKLNSNSSVSNGIGKKITLLGGTLEAQNNNGAYLSSNHDIEVPAAYSSTLIAAPRCEYNGKLTGGGTLNWSCDFIRAYLNGDWSAYEGRLNVNANSANSDYENHFIVNNIKGFPNATLNLASGVIMCYKNGTADNGTTTIKIGMLTGVAGSTFYNAGLEVGSNNANGSFAGIISGVTSVNKVGSGLWIISGANTYTGSTTISSGTMTLSGSLSTGTVTVANSAILNLNGNIGGSLVISSGGLVNLTSTVGGQLTNSGTLKGIGTITGNAILNNNSITIPGNTAIGTLNFSGNVTMNNLANISMQVAAGSTNCDKIVATGTFTCNGILDVTSLSGTFTLTDTYKIISAASIIGTFSSINLPVLPLTLAWDKSELYTAGILKLKSTTGIYFPTLQTGVKQNPTDGKFLIYSDQSFSHINVVVNDLQGKTVLITNVDSGENSFEIDLTNQPSGIYLLRLVADKEYSNVLKLIKK